MWSQLVLCALVGLAFGSQNPAWKDNHQYVYEVRGRTLASLDGISNDYSGILVKSRLVVIPRPNGILHAQLEEAQYAQVQAVLPEGWQYIIPDSQLQYQSLPISKHPFHIIQKNGAVRDLIVSKEITNWEANFIKSIVSQFQLDTHAENLIDSAINTLPQSGQNNAVFKTMEDTITGISETLYEIHPMPEYVIQSQPWLIPHPELEGADEESMEIVKSKNYSRAEQRPAYHYGYYEMESDFDPASNKMGDFFSRSSVSRATVTGKLDRYTVQNSYTVDEIEIRPSQVDAQTGSVNSLLNVTLSSVKPHVGQGGDNDIPSPISLGNLVYRFDLPFGQSNKARPGKPFERQTQSSGELNGNSQESEEQYQNDQESNSADEQDWQQPQPKLNEAPASPLLPFNVGYGGLSIKNKQNIVEIVRKLAQQIGQDLQSFDKLPEVNAMGKFVTLTSLVRAMNDKEMEQVAGQLYSKDQQGPQRASWIAYRDAVSQAGTGPSLITIQEWIKTQKIQGDEAADAVEVQASAARQPTEEYIRSFYQMVIAPEVSHHKLLNESALLSFTNLVHRVYANKEKSHNNYPVHVFGSFRTQAGRQYLEEEVIPQLTQKLHQAIAKADTQQIHVYIRALGNVGHRKILAAFEPYLEGQKPATQFQRLLMLLSFDKLVRADPFLARNVLYKIYQNAADDENVRAVAVFQLMRTAPSADVLQRMAVYTNTDPSEHVNAAVKSSIESAARLEGDQTEIAAFRQAAQSAKDLLTKREYGHQYTQNHLRSYVIDHMKYSYKQTVQSIGSEDSYAADGWRYSLRERLGGVRQELINAHGLVSSIDDLLNVFQEQTEEYRQQQARKQQQKPGEWTNEKIAEMLEMTVSNDEQLEGNLFVEHTLLQRLFSFDNSSIEQLPQVLREIEEELKSGKQYHHTRMAIYQEKAIAFPTEMGWPLFYTYDKPALTHIEAKLKAEATPRVSSGSTLNKPEKVQGEIELHGVFYGKTQTQLGFLTPFDHQKYTAGYDKNFQVQLPFNGKITLDVKNTQLQADFQFNANLNKNSRLVHFSTWPYTYKGEILNWQTSQRKVIAEQNPGSKFETVIGKEFTGLPLKVDYTSDDHMDIPTLYKKLQDHDGLSAVLGPWIDDRIQYSQFNAKVDLSQFSPESNKMSIRLGVQHKYHPESQPQSNESQQNKVQLGELDKMSAEPLQRQQQFLKTVAAGIHNADAYTFDAVLAFQTQQKLPIEYLLTAAIAKSNADPKSQLIAHFRKIGQGKTFHAALSAKSHVPNTNGLSMNYAMDFDPTSTSQVELALGEDQKSAARFEAQIRLRKSEDRKAYLKQQSMYHDCQREMQEGNHQLPACANLTVQANFYDRLNVKVQYQNVRPDVINATYKAYSLLRQSLYLNADENLIAGGNGKDEIELEARIDSELDNANLTITTKSAHVKINSIPVEEWAKDMFVPHPVFHAKARLMGRALAYNGYRPSCVVDKTVANTFNNKTYPLTLSTGDWTLMMQYVPRTAANKQQQQQGGEDQPAEKQLRHQIETYAVLVRGSSSAGQKEVKIVVQSPRTQQQNMEINMKPNAAPKVSVNGQEIKYSNEQSTDFSDGQIQIYGLPNNEVKVELHGAFYVIYDGSRAKLTVTDGKFRSSVRGLCGSFTGDENTDFQSPKQCILHEPLEFIATNTIMVPGQAQNQLTADLKNSAQRRECYQKETRYVNVISDRDVGRVQDSQHQDQSNQMCTKHQTRYVAQNGEICFTLRPLPICKSQCQQRGTIVKNIPVHCVAESKSSHLWKTQIDKGASPDFSLKTESRRVTMDIPRRCSP